jgi:hypothetical protein
MNKIVGDISMKTPTKEFLASIGNVSCTDSFAVRKCLLVFSNSFSIILFATTLFLCTFSLKLRLHD